MTAAGRSSGTLSVRRSPRRGRRRRRPACPQDALLVNPRISVSKIASACRTALGYLFGNLAGPSVIVSPIGTRSALERHRLLSSRERSSLHSSYSASISTVVGNEHIRQGHSLSRRFAGSELRRTTRTVRPIAQRAVRLVGRVILLGRADRRLEHVVEPRFVVGQDRIAGEQPRVRRRARPVLRRLRRRRRV
ncbi:hypothetical protein C8039_04460 [Halogeometricum sp. wsp3]|nr:hypothetical protein C8039_04460 [Halogeometricum sp. wsp3]